MYVSFRCPSPSYLLVLAHIRKGILQQKLLDPSTPLFAPLFVLNYGTICIGSMLYAHDLGAPPTANAFQGFFWYVKFSWANLEQRPSWQVLSCTFTRRLWSNDFHLVRLGKIFPSSFLCYDGRFPGLPSGACIFKNTPTILNPLFIS